MHECVQEHEQTLACVESNFVHTPQQMRVHDLHHHAQLENVRQLFVSNSKEQNKTTMSCGKSTINTYLFNYYYHSNMVHSTQREAMHKQK